MSFPKSKGTQLSSKYCKKYPDSAKNSTADATKTNSKRAIQNTAEATGALIGNKSDDKIKSVFKKSKKLENNEVNDEETPKERYISPGKKNNKLLMN